MTSEADATRDALFGDPFVSNADYGRLVEEAAGAVEAAALEDERPSLDEEPWCDRWTR